MKIPPLRKNPDGRAFVEIPKSGRKRVYFGLYNTAEATEEYAAWVRRYTDGLKSAKKPTERDEVIPIYVEYLEFLKPTVTPQVFAQAKLGFLKFSNYAGKGVLVRDVTPALIRGYQKHLSKQTYTKGGTEINFSRRYCNDLIKRFKRFVRWAVGEGSLPTDVLLRVDTVEPLKRGKTEARETRKVLPVSWADVQRTLPFLNPTMQAMVRVQFLCGMRPSEVCRMRRDGIDRSGKQINGERVWLYEPPTHKGTWRDESLMKAIPPIAQTILLDWENRGDCGDYFFSPRQATKDAYNWKGPWTPGERPEWDQTLSTLADHYSTRSYDGGVVSGVKRAREVIPDLPYWSPNQLRHGMATLLRRHVSVQAASTYAGHKKIDTTMIYAHRTEEELVKIAYQLDKIIEREGEKSNGS